MSDREQEITKITYDVVDFLDKKLASVRADPDEMLTVVGSVVHSLVSTLAHEMESDAAPSEKYDFVKKAILRKLEEAMQYVAEH